jgi:hypothetical protein
MNDHQSTLLLAGQLAEQSRVLAKGQGAAAASRPQRVNIGLGRECR